MEVNYVILLHRKKCCYLIKHAKPDRVQWKACPECVFKFLHESRPVSMSGGELSVGAAMCEWCNLPMQNAKDCGNILGGSNNTVSRLNELA